MKNLLKKSLFIGVLTIFAFSCSDDSEVVTDPTDQSFDVELSFSETGGNVSKTVAITPGKTSIKARLQITSTSKDMRRVYITRNVDGKGFEPYKINLTNKALKPDGSIDVESTPRAIDYTLNLEAPSGVTGTVVYRFWATSGRGDYRDETNSFVAGLGEIVLNYGGTNPAAPVKSYSAKILEAPADDLSSNTFISLYDGQIYKISQGEEFAALWDFGYFHTGSKANLASTSYYNTAFNYYDDVFPIGIQFNNCYFLKSTKTITEFNNIKISSDLSFVSANESSPQEITNLAKDDIIEFVDNYGKKGLIQVVKIQGTYNSSTDYIQLNIKVQP